MSRSDTPGITPDDDPLDAAAVVADEALVERLRRAMTPEDAVVWDDDDDLDDPGYALLLALARDVAADIPADGLTLPAGVTALAPRTRRLTRTATVALVAAGVVSIGGVAAAAAPGRPLSGLRSSVADAVSSVVDAITPSAPVGPTVAGAGDSARPTPTATPPGIGVSSAARDAAAVTQIRANLDRAASLLRAGHYSAAKEQLDAAARKLDLVHDADIHAALAEELGALRVQLASPHPSATHPVSPHKPAAPGTHRKGTPDKGTAPANESRRAPSVVPSAKSRSADNGGAPSAPGVVSHAPVHRP